MKEKKSGKLERSKEKVKQMQPAAERKLEHVFLDQHCHAFLATCVTHHHVQDSQCHTKISCFSSCTYKFARG